MANINTTSMQVELKTLTSGRMISSTRWPRGRSRSNGGKRNIFAVRFSAPLVHERCRNVEGEWYSGCRTAMTC